MRHMRNVIRMKAAGLPSRAIALRMGAAPSTVRRFETAGSADDCRPYVALRQEQLSGPACSTDLRGFATAARALAIGPQPILCGQQTSARACHDRTQAAA